MIVFIFLILLSIPAGTVFSRNGLQPGEPGGREGLFKLVPDSLAVDSLFHLAWYRLDVDGYPLLADSLGRSAIGMAERTHDPRLLFQAFNRYAETTDLQANYGKVLAYLARAEQVQERNHDPSATFRVNRNLAEAFLAAGDFDRALSCGYKILSLADAAGIDSMKTEGYLCIGRSLDGKNQKLEAFRNYLNATTLAERAGNNAQKVRCYSMLSGFYSATAKQHEKAVRYKLLQRQLILNSMPVDSVALMWTEYDLLVIGLNADPAALQGQNSQVILDFAIRHHHRRMLDFMITLLRTSYIRSNDIGSLRTLYYVRFPGEFERLSQRDPALYYRLKAFFCEEDRRIDSAGLFFRMAEKSLQSNPNLTLRSNFYHRYGQFLLRNGEPVHAATMFMRSYELADSARYIDYLLQAARQLQELYAQKKDYANAYRFALLNKTWSDSLTGMSKKDELLTLELDHETRQREFIAGQERQRIDRRHSLQYTAMTIGIFTVFLILIMLGSLRVHEWIIRSLGFFSFIFLFEFIIMLADHRIMELTHGEPWKVLLIKIFLIAILLPLHHAIEKRVIAYLLNHKLLDISRLATVGRLRDHVNRWKSGRVGRKGNGNGN